MSNTFTLARRAALFLLAASAVLALGGAQASYAQPPQRQPKGQQQPSGPREPKKKLQAGSNFSGYAGRDASNRLIAGGATRDVSADEGTALRQKGQDAYDAGQFDEAVAAFTRLSGLKPGEGLPFYYLGAAHEAAGHAREAVNAYRRAVELLGKSGAKPEDGAAFEALLVSYFNLGNLLADAQKPLEAAEAYKRVIAHAADQPVAHYNLGLAYAAAGQTAEAVASFKQSIDLFARSLKQDESEVDKERYADAYFNLGIVHGKLEQYGEAADAFRRAVQLRSDYAEARYNLALALGALGDGAAARAELKALETLKPELAAKLKGLIE